MPDLGQEGQVGFVCSGKQPRRLRDARCERITDAKILLVILKLLRTGFRAMDGIHQKGLAEHGGALRPAGPPPSPEEGENLPAAFPAGCPGAAPCPRAALPLRQHNSSYCCCRLSCSCLMTAEGKEQSPGAHPLPAPGGEEEAPRDAGRTQGFPVPSFWGYFPEFCHLSGLLAERCMQENSLGALSEGLQIIILG